MKTVFFLLVAFLLSAGCLQATKATDQNRDDNISKEIQTAKTGDRVKVHYIGRLETGEIFDQSAPERPLEFTVGAGQVIQGFEEGAKGMKEGETKTITIPPEQGYGFARQDQIVEVPKQKFGEQAESLRVGMEVTASNGTKGKITEIYSDTNTVKIDFNHELAGKTLIFEITLVEIES